MFQSSQDAAKAAIEDSRREREVKALERIAEALEAIRQLLVAQR